jgi:hypothetical protein
MLVQRLKIGEVLRRQSRYVEQRVGQIDALVGAQAGAFGALRKAPDLAGEEIERRPWPAELEQPQRGRLGEIGRRAREAHAVAVGDHRFVLPPESVVRRTEILPGEG